EIARVPKLVQYYHDLLTSILTPLPDLPGVAIEAEPSVEAVQVQAETIPRTGEANDFRFWPQTVISMPELTSALKKRQEYLSGLPGSFIPALDSMLKAGPGEVLLVLGENVFETAAFGFHLCFSVCLEAEFPLLLFGSEPGPERLADMVSSQDQNFLDGKMAFINTQIGYIPHLPVGHELDSFFEQLVIEDTETIITGSVSDVRAALRLADKLRKAKLGGVIASSAPSNVETGDFAWEFSLGSGTYSGGPGGVVLLRNCGDHRFEADIIRSNIGSPGLVAVRFVPSTYRFKENGHDGDGRPA
ncbi:MAG: hypothetical protein QGH40_12030, partial [bacterium]|nr:hypothetical protein [bacterium]